MSTETQPANEASKTTSDVYFRCFKGCEGRHSVFDVHMSVVWKFAGGLPRA